MAPRWRHFPCLFHYFSEHRFFMYLSSILQGNLYFGGSITVDFRRPASNWRNHKNHVFSNTSAYFTLSQTHVFSLISRHVSLQFVSIICCYILHQCWRHCGMILASKLKFFRYRLFNNFLMCFSTPFGT